MDPSAAPWRVLESPAPPPGGERPAGDTASSPARALLISPITAAAVVGAIVLAIGAFLLASASTGAGGVDVRGGGALASVSALGDGGTPDDAAGLAGPATGPDVLIVEIAGAVARPGVFRMAVGSRVGDLIDAAGGYGPRLDAARANRELNLAARLADGDRVTVPSRDEAASSTSATGGGGTPSGGGSASDGGSATTVIDLNRATASELEALPGIGPVTAAKIITSREEAVFTAVDDLRTRKLVGAKTFDKLKDLVAVR